MFMVTMAMSVSRICNMPRLMVPNLLANAPAVSRLVSRKA